MTTIEKAADLVTLAEAARFAERSEPSMRRLVRSGLITRYDGPPSPGGGSPPILVSRQELQGYLITSNQRPRNRPGIAQVTTDRSGAIRSGDQVGGTGDTPQLTAILRERLLAMDERIRLTEQLAEANARAITSERDAALAQVRLLSEELDRTRRDRDDWRDRHDAREAELTALRTQAGGSWWRRLLPG